MQLTVDYTSEFRQYYRFTYREYISHLTKKQNQNGLFMARMWPNYTVFFQETSILLKIDFKTSLGKMLTD